MTDQLSPHEWTEVGADHVLHASINGGRLRLGARATEHGWHAWIESDYISRQAASDDDETGRSLHSHRLQAEVALWTMVADIIDEREGT